MIPQYIEYWIRIIETMDNKNTYKLAWGRAIVEYVSKTEIDESKDFLFLEYKKAAEIVLKYYWNQSFFFNLKQAPDKHKANIIDDVNNLISLYKKLTHSDNPKCFQDVEGIIKDTDEYEKKIKSIATLLKINPAKYFLNASTGKSNKTNPLEVYTYSKPNKGILLKKEDAKQLKEYGIVIAKLLNYKWTQLLENYNFVPKLSNKITAISNGMIERNDLKEYRKQLLKQFNDGKIIDFYTGEELNKNNISVDHVIPWSFMYSDDIWNLVLTSKSNNSSKSNLIPSEEVIRKLKERNLVLKNIVDEKYQNDLLLAEINHSVDNYYYECKVSR